MQTPLNQTLAYAVSQLRADFVAFSSRKLEALGITDIHELETCYGLTATIHGGKPGKTVGLRADTDALSFQEETGLPFASCEPGKMHARGHDTHIAMLLGAARMLKENEDALAGRVKLMFQPGEKWFYGASADVLGAVLEKAADMPLDALYRKRVFQPLGMTDTDFYVPEEKRSRLAQLYQYVWDGSRGGLVVEPDPHLGMTDYRKKPAFFSAGAGLVSTLPDYLQFAAMLAGKGLHRASGVRLIGENTWRYLTTPQLNEAQKKWVDWDSLKGYSYGNLLRVLEDPLACMTNVPAGEFGWDGWTGPYFCVSPQDGTVLLYLIQTCGGSGSDVVRKLRAAVFGTV